MNTQQNQQIIDGIVSGDEIVLKAFYKKNMPYVHKYIIQYQGKEEDVQDIFQDALVVIYHKLRADELELTASIDAYFMGVCKNLWKNQLRKKQLLEYNELLLEKTIDPSASVTDLLTQKHQKDIYNNHFNKLSSRNQRILFMFFEGKSMKDIADITGYSEGYTRRKKYKIKELLISLVRNDPMYPELVMN